MQVAPGPGRRAEKGRQDRAGEGQLPAGRRDRAHAGVGVVDEPLVDLLEEALGALEEGDTALRARVLARLAAELYFAGGEQRRVSLSRQAVMMARRIGDPAVLAYTLSCRHLALWGPRDLEERLAIAAEIVGLAGAIGDRELALQGHAWRINGLIRT